jgi:hypothetical protein
LDAVEVKSAAILWRQVINPLKASQDSCSVFFLRDLEKRIKKRRAATEINCWRRKGNWGWIVNKYPVTRRAGIEGINVRL